MRHLDPRADSAAAADPAQADRALAAASRAAARAGVTVRAVDDMADLRAVSALLVAVWGRNDEGAPVPSEVLRSLAHAGGCTTAAYDAGGTLCGAATLAVAAPAGATYSLIAAAAPGAGDRGIGRALKLHQRAWALARGYRSMMWTFDPLVARNARFNLVRLGAEAAEYVVAFYGRMSDEVNGDDDADRLVATWSLASDRAQAAADERAAVDPTEPGDVLGDGPDALPMLTRAGDTVRVRVPRDVVALRRDDPSQAARWRTAVREAMTAAFGDGMVATHLTRDGWYVLTPGGSR